MDYSHDIKSRITMRDVCDLYGIEVNRSGFARCPFHGEKTASMKVYPGNKGFHCYGCGTGGSVIDFTMQFFTLPFFEAEKKLNDDFHLNLPIGQHLSEDKQKEAERAAKKRRLDLDRKRRKHSRLEKAYHAAYDRFALLDRAVDAFAPEGPLDEFLPEYVLAVSQLDAARYALDLAESKLLEFERKGE